MKPAAAAAADMIAAIAMSTAAIDPTAGIALRAVAEIVVEIVVEIAEEIADRVATVAEIGPRLGIGPRAGTALPAGTALRATTERADGQPLEHDF